MSDRIKGCVVTFSRDIRDDDFEAVLAAIRMIKGVGCVTASVASIDDHMNRQRIRMDLERKLNAALDNAFREVE